MQMPGWRIEKVKVIRDDILDEDCSGYELQENGNTICKLDLESLRKLKQFFEQLDLPNNK